MGFWESIGYKSTAPPQSTRTSSVSFWQTGGYIPPVQQSKQGEPLPTPVPPKAVTIVKTTELPKTTEKKGSFIYGWGAGQGASVVSYRVGVSGEEQFRQRSIRNFRIGQETQTPLEKAYYNRAFLSGEMAPMASKMSWKQAKPPKPLGYNVSTTTTAASKTFGQSLTYRAQGIYEGATKVRNPIFELTVAGPALFASSVIGLGGVAFSQPSLWAAGIETGKAFGAGLVFTAMYAPKYILGRTKEDRAITPLTFLGAGLTGYAIGAGIGKISGIKSPTTPKQTKLGSFNLGITAEKFGQQGIVQTARRSGKPFPFQGGVSRFPKSQPLEPVFIAKIGKTTIEKYPMFKLAGEEEIPRFAQFGAVRYRTRQIQIFRPRPVEQVQPIREFVLQKQRPKTSSALKETFGIPGRRTNKGMAPSEQLPFKRIAGKAAFGMGFATFGTQKQRQKTGKLDLTLPKQGVFQLPRIGMSSLIIPATAITLLPRLTTTTTQIQPPTELTTTTQIPGIPTIPTYPTDPTRQGRRFGFSSRNGAFFKLPKVKNLFGRGSEYKPSQLGRFRGKKASFKFKETKFFTGLEVRGI